MNENIDLTKILKDCPMGWEFYSSIYGSVEFSKVGNNTDYPIKFSVIDKDGIERNRCVTKQGLFLASYDGECTFFPSKDQQDWSKFSAPWYKKDKFDPKTLQPFDKVIARINKQGLWCCDLFSFIEEDTNLIKGSGAYYKQCIPYNDDTKYLLGTKNEAPEFYRYWKD